MKKRLLSRGAVLAGCSAALLGVALTVATSASADHRFDFTLSMSGSEEVPPNASTATGSATFTIDTATNELCYAYSFSGLSSPVVAAYIHGFAGPGAAAPPLFTLPLTTPASGCVTYTESQEANLLAGLAYINIHTQNFPAGEIRGQIDEPSPEPHPDTRIDSGPTGAVATPEVTFTYSSIPPEAVDHFECKLDGGSFEPCPDAGKTYAGLLDGEHDFAVFATDAETNADLSPAARSFTVDTELTGAKLNAKKTQTQGSKVRIKAKASADEAFAVLAKGKIKIKGRHRAIKLKPQRKPAGAADTKLALGPARKKDQRKVLQALQAGGKAVAEITVRFSDAAGNLQTLKARIMLR